MKHKETKLIKKTKNKYQLEITLILKTGDEITFDDTLDETKLIKMIKNGQKN